jgi:hypothetical protein
MKTIKLTLALVVTSALYLGLAQGISRASEVDVTDIAISRHNGGIVAHEAHDSPVVETSKASAVASGSNSALRAVTSTKCPAGWIEESGVCLPG